MFLFTTSDSEEEEEVKRRDTSVRIEDKIDDLEEALEREVGADRNTSHFMYCIGGVLKVIIRWYIWLRNEEHSD